MDRIIYNPIQKDYVTFLKTSEETNGQYTLVEVELADGGGVGLHYHRAYSKAFHNGIDTDLIHKCVKF